MAQFLTAVDTVPATFGCIWPYACWKGLKTAFESENDNAVNFNTSRRSQTGTRGADRMVNFFADDHYVSDPNLSRMCREFWSGSQENGGLVGDLWVEGAFPAEVSEDTLESLTSQTLFDPDLMLQLDTEERNPRQRPLYKHQAEAVRDCSTDWAERRAARTRRHRWNRRGQNRKLLIAGFG